MTDTEIDQAEPAKRLASVDALRGFDMFWIMGGREFILSFAALIFSGAPPWLDHQLEHVPWEGFVAWDLIMPLFIFVSGVALPFSMSKWKGSGDSKRSFYLRVARRLVILWILGMAVQGNLLAWDLDKLRLYTNTLQSIASGYLIGTIFLLTMSIRTQLIATAGLLLSYWAILEFAPVPDIGAGVLEPWKDFANYFDDLVLGHFADGGNYTWVISSLGFGATLMMGVFAGHALRSNESDQQKLNMLLAMGIGCLATGWIWSIWHPMIKHIWTSSMNLWAGGWCFLLLAAFYWIIDVRGYKKWAFPLIVIGTNAIAVYVATHLFNFRHISNIFVGSLVERLENFGVFLSAFGALLVPWLILLYMYKKKTFIRL